MDITLDNEPVNEYENFNTIVKDEVVVDNSNLEDDDDVFYNNSNNEEVEDNSNSTEDEDEGEGDSEVEVDEVVLYAVIRDDVVQGFCDTRKRALEVMSELADEDMLNAPSNEIYRRSYDELRSSLQIYSQYWTLAIFPYERLEHSYFVRPIKHIE